MARRQNISPQQFGQMLERSGISPGAIKARVRAEIVWNQLVRGKFNSTLQIGESDIANALKSRNEAETKVGYTYTLYPITLVADRSQNEGAHGCATPRRRKYLRGRFTSCSEGLAMVRALRNVAVREPVHRSSADLPPQLRDLLGNMEVGRLTTPESDTAQGPADVRTVRQEREQRRIQPVKREVREDLFNKRFEAEGKRFLDEIRKQAMIEYKK